MIDLLVSCLADPGDGILVARPFYNGFAASFECRSGVIPVGVDVPVGEESGIAAVDAYEKRLLECRNQGIVVRAIMICNPHNPLGTFLRSALYCLLTDEDVAGFCYSKETLLAYARFAEKYDLHLVSDEIYALSVFKTDGASNEHLTRVSLTTDDMQIRRCKNLCRFSRSILFSKQVATPLVSTASTAHPSSSLSR